LANPRRLTKINEFKRTRRSNNDVTRRNVSVHDPLSVKLYKLCRESPEQFQYHGITESRPYRLPKLVQR
jgi:hypothetical protein